MIQGKSIIHMCLCAQIKIIGTGQRCDALQLGR